MRRWVSINNTHLVLLTMTNQKWESEYKMIQRMEHIMEIYFQVMLICCFSHETWEAEKNAYETIHHTS